MFYKELANLIPAVVDKRVSISALACVLVDADKKTISGTDMDIFFTLKEAPITGKGSIVVDAYALQGIAKGTKKDFSLAMGKNKDGAAELIVESDGDKYTLPSQEKIENFPVLEEKKVDSFIEKIPVDLFKVAFSMSTEETRYYLRGVNLHLEGACLKAVATDGHRLALRQAAFHVSSGSGFEKKNSIIVPQKSVKAIRKLFDGDITLQLRGNRLCISEKNIYFVTKLIDGNFPDYERVIPKQDNAKAVVEVEAKEIARLCGKSIIVDGNKGQFFGGPGGYWFRLMGNKSSVEKHIHKEAVHNFNVGLNSDYLSDILEDMEEDKFTFRWIDESSPMHITSGSNLYILMPMRL